MAHVPVSGVILMPRARILLRAPSVFAGQVILVMAGSVLVW